MTAPSSVPKDKSASRQIDDIIKKLGDWRGEKLSQLRAIIMGADPAAGEEVKWKKPSKPEGAPVWSDGKIICVGDVVKSAGQVNFPQSCTAE